MSSGALYKNVHRRQKGPQLRGWRRAEGLVSASRCRGVIREDQLSSCHLGSQPCRRRCAPKGFQVTRRSPEAPVRNTLEKDHSITAGTECRTQGEEPTFSKSSPLCPTKRTLVTYAATSLMGHFRRRQEPAVATADTEAMNNPTGARTHRSRPGWLTFGGTTMAPALGR